MFSIDYSALKTALLSGAGAVLCSSLILAAAVMPAQAASAAILGH